MIMSLCNTSIKYITPTSKSRRISLEVTSAKKRQTCASNACSLLSHVNLYLYSLYHSASQYLVTQISYNASNVTDKSYIVLFLFTKSSSLLAANTRGELWSWKSFYNLFLFLKSKIEIRLRNQQISESKYENDSKNEKKK